jgi:hypothetical protein
MVLAFINFQYTFLAISVVATGQLWSKSDEFSFFFFFFFFPENMATLFIYLFTVEKPFRIDWQSPFCFFFFFLLSPKWRMFSFNKRSWSGPDASEEEAAAAAAGTGRLHHVQDQTATRKIWWLARTMLHSSAFLSCVVGWGFKHCEFVRICANLSPFGGPGDAPHTLAHIIPSKIHGRS